MTSTPKRHAVAFCVDAGYLPFAAHAATQIVALDPDDSFDILICSAAPLTLPPGLAGGRIRMVTLESPVDALRTRNHVSVAAYLLYYLPVILGEDYDRILYLDADIFVQGGDFAALLDVDLHGRTVGAVSNMSTILHRRRVEEFRIAGLPQAPYFNSGVVLIDTAAWRAKALTAAAVDLSATRGHEFPLHDQSVLNVVLHRDWAELSPVWNFEGFKDTRLAETMVFPNIVHFTTDLKPWNDTFDLTPPRFSVPMHAFVTRHFPGIPFRAPGHPARNPRRMRALSWRLYKIAPRLAAHLARFDDDLTVLT